MNILLIFSHPRRESLTGVLMDHFVEGAIKAGSTVETADLYAEGFDPCLQPLDEPDYDDPTKVYSNTVLREMARVERNDALVMFYPIWWWSVPAILKGWIDQVFNHGWAFGWNADNIRIPINDVLMVGLGGCDEEVFKKYGYEESMHNQLNFGILEYCGVDHVRTEYFFDTLNKNAPFEEMKVRAHQLGEEFSLII